MDQSAPIPSVLVRIPDASAPNGYREEWRLLSDIARELERGMLATLKQAVYSSGDVRPPQQTP